MHQNLIMLVSSSETKLWIVPRLDNRNIESHRHEKDLSFPDALDENDLPQFVIHAKALWNKCFRNENQQQPTRPSSISSGTTNVVRFLGHSSIKSGWDHLKVTLYQMGKVCLLYVV